MRLRALCLYFKALVIPFVLVAIASWGTALHGQSIRIKLVNGRNGSPMAHTCVNVGVGHIVHMLAIPTNEDGIAELRLTHNDSEINTQNHWKGCGDWGVIDPVVKYGDDIGINAGYVLCQMRTDYSWLAITKFSTLEVLQHGIVMTNTCGKATASPTPGEVVLFVRPLTWWEKLKS